MLWQLIILVLLLFLGVILAKKLRRAFINLSVTLQGPFYAPTSDERITDLLKLVKLKPTDKVVDLGSGDGRVLIALAQKYQVNAVGYEIDPELITESRENITNAGLEKKITIEPQSFWEADLSPFDTIVVYCVPRFLKRLEEKLEKEMQSSAQVASVFFRFPTWKPTTERGDIRLYRKKA